MSAITGCCRLEGYRNVENIGGALMNALTPFPSDHRGFWYMDGIYLGCHAQWITPESIGEKAPLFDETKNLAVAADAILDNREELFDLLQLTSPLRRIVTDGELILLAYDKWGDESPRYLVGDFAYVIWDERKKRLFGARDYSGTRTLYYTQNLGMFAFCTLIQPLLALDDRQAAPLNEQWLAEYLANPGRIETMDVGSTVYRDVRQLPPHHSIAVENGKVRVRRYAEVEAQSLNHLRRDRDYVEAFADVLQKSVASRLRTFKQVGSYLSGGLDSGTVAGFAARTLAGEQKPLHTFSYIPADGFEDWTPANRLADERPYIRSTVEAVGNIRDQYLSFPGRSPYSELDKWLDMMEMPFKFVENAFWLSGIYEQAERENVGVLLNGGRGNYTISWGPALDYYALLLKRMRWIRLYGELKQYGSNRGIGRRRLLELVRQRAFPHPASSAAGDIPAERLIHPDFAARTRIFERMAASGVYVPGKPPMTMIDARQRQFAEVGHWTNSGVSGTKLSIRHGLWYRDPTNDLRLARFCLGLPIGQFVREGMDRAMVRRATEGILPDRVRLNYKVRGVQGADGIYRMKPHWPAFVAELQRLCEDARMQSLVDTSYLRKAISNNREPSPNTVFDGEFVKLMRSVVLYRFLKRLKGGDINEQRVERTFSGGA
ncbi:asparagine synthase-related protein [Cohnella sp. GbtcB17]|uniref:asparagine synthase-related protein n=1 Tax=Cohnella sp. GbtcB17 TaxID=2824762 RepID=UPI001C304741|nr:asparagine synthase-related protein [Cohnella sp. GbtcB17]